MQGPLHEQFKFWFAGGKITTDLIILLSCGIIKERKQKEKLRELKNN